jgi:hypothetical protein
MPNWCNNTIEFQGKKENLDLLKSKITQSYDGQLLHSSIVVDSYFFDILIHDGSSENVLTLTYDSKWTHNFGDVAEICKEFNLTANAEFGEPSNDYYGECDYNADGTYRESFISEAFLSEVEYNYDTDVREYRGGEWEYIDDLIQDEYLPWVKELIESAYDDDAETFMTISSDYISRAVGNKDNAKQLIQLLTSRDIPSIKLGLILYKTI